MEDLPDDRKEAMGEFHNAIVAMVDSTKLTTLEVSTVLRMVASNIDKLFETMVKGG